MPDSVPISNQDIARVCFSDTVQLQTGFRFTGGRYEAKEDREGKGAIQLSAGS